MSDIISRRHFLKRASLLPLCAAWVPLDGSGPAIQAGTKPRGNAASAALKVSLNAYSFNTLLNDAQRGRGAGMTLVEVLEFAAKTGFEGFDPTGYYFPGYPKVPTISASGSAEQACGITLRRRTKPSVTPASPTSRNGWKSPHGWARRSSACSPIRR
jgi:hypothetical protein